MYISRNKSVHQSGRTYYSILLRESYREGKKVKKRTIANLSALPENLIHAIEISLKSPSQIPSTSSDFELIQGKSIGSALVLHTIAQRLGITDALGSSFHAQLALWLIIARIIEQGSRLSATRLNTRYDLSSIIGLKRGFDENNLYDCLHWLSKNQEEIENKLFKKSKTSQFYWYDVTSSYFEGCYNELAAFGYNRDKKKRKRIVVVGLLCQEDGNPISIEGFKGNTQDTQTFESQLIKLQKRFNAESITVISDRGLIRKKQKLLLKKYGFHYITALTMPEVHSLINAGSISRKDFTHNLKSFSKDGIRYIYRCNTERALETQRQREERLETAQRKVGQENAKLRDKPKMSSHLAKKRIQKVIKKLCIFEWVNVNIEKKQIILSIDQQKLKEKATFDGCYIWTTDRKASEVSDREVYDQYKNLKYIEDDFRTFKTSFLEIRPIFVRTEHSTRGHLLVIMLAHMIVRELRKAWKSFNLTVEEGLRELSLICRHFLRIGEREINCIPTTADHTNLLLDALKIKLPKILEKIDVPVVTRHKIRKSVSV
jgi:transposase